MNTSSSEARRASRWILFDNLAAYVTVVTVCGALKQQPLGRVEITIVLWQAMYIGVMSVLLLVRKSSTAPTSKSHFITLR